MATDLSFPDNIARYCTRRLSEDAFLFTDISGAVVATISLEREKASLLGSLIGQSSKIIPRVTFETTDKLLFKDPNTESDCTIACLTAMIIYAHGLCCDGETDIVLPGEDAVFTNRDTNPTLADNLRQAALIAIRELRYTPQP